MEAVGQPRGPAVAAAARPGPRAQPPEPAERGAESVQVRGGGARGCGNCGHGDREREGEKEPRGRRSAAVRKVPRWQPAWERELWERDLYGAAAPVPFVPKVCEEKAPREGAGPRCAGRRSPLLLPLLS